MKSKWIAIVLIACLLLMCSAALSEENKAPSGNNYVYADGWLYRTHFANDMHQLVRTRSDGTDAQLVSQGHGLYDFFSIVGDTVYYLGTEKELGGFDTRQQIRAVNTDGSDDRALTKLAEYEMLFASNTHVYVERGDYKWVRFRIHPWGKENTFKLPNDEFGFRIADGYLYCQVSASDPVKIVRMRPEGGKSTPIFKMDGPDELSTWTVQDGNLIYCLTNVENASGEVWRMPLGSDEKQLVYSGDVSVIEIKDGWGYGRHISPGGAMYGLPYTLSFGDMVRINIQTGEMQELGNRGNNFFPAGDHLIYDPYDEGAPLMLDPATGATQPLPQIVIN